jgi:hypothetical protein
MYSESVSLLQMLGRKMTPEATAGGNPVDTTATKEGSATAEHSLVLRLLSREPAAVVEAIQVLVVDNLTEFFYLSDGRMSLEEVVAELFDVDEYMSQEKLANMIGLLAAMADELLPGFGKFVPYAEPKDEAALANTSPREKPVSAADMALGNAAMKLSQYEAALSGFAVMEGVPPSATLLRYKK